MELEEGYCLEQDQSSVDLRAASSASVDTHLADDSDRFDLHGWTHRLADPSPGTPGPANTADIKTPSGSGEPDRRGGTLIFF